MQIMQTAVGVGEEKIVAGWVVAAMFIYVHKYNKHFSNIDTLFLNCIGSQKKIWIKQSGIHSVSGYFLLILCCLNNFWKKG